MSLFVQSLYLHNFRNFEQTTVHFSPEVNIIYGDNAQGKTNLLEALYFFSTGRSFRTAHLQELIREGASSFFLEIHFIKEGIEQSLIAQFDGTSRKLVYNHTKYSSFTPLFGILPSVIYAPSDYALIMGVPAERRRFFDLYLAQIDPLYVHHAIRYHKAVKQRNYLLKKKNSSLLFPWEEIMAYSAAYLMKERKETMDEYKDLLQSNMLYLSESKDSLCMLYEPSFQGTEVKHLLEELKKNHSKELLLGSSLIGPHKDDFHILINDKKAKSFASEGQKRCSLAALRLAQWETLKRKTSTSPFMLIDDFTIHLDNKRTELFQSFLPKLGQVFVTSPTPLSLTATQKELYIEKGKIITHQSGV